MLDLVRQGGGGDGPSSSSGSGSGLATSGSVGLLSSLSDHLKVELASAHRDNEALRRDVAAAKAASEASHTRAVRSEAELALAMAGLRAREATQRIPEVALLVSAWQELGVPTEVRTARCIAARTRARRGQRVRAQERDAVLTEIGGCVDAACAKHAKDASARRDGARAEIAKLATVSSALAGVLGQPSAFIAASGGILHQARAVVSSMHGSVSAHGVALSRSSRARRRRRASC